MPAKSLDSDGGLTIGTRTVSSQPGQARNWWNVRADLAKLEATGDLDQLQAPCAEVLELWQKRARTMLRRLTIGHSEAQPPRFFDIISYKNFGFAQAGLDASPAVSVISTVERQRPY